MFTSVISTSFSATDRVLPIVTSWRWIEEVCDLTLLWLYLFSICIERTSGSRKQWLDTLSLSVHMVFLSFFLSTHLLSMFVSLNARSAVSALAKIPLVDKHCYHICIIDTGTWSLILLWFAPRIFTLHTISMLFTWMNTVSHIFMV